MQKKCTTLTVLSRLIGFLVETVRLAMSTYYVVDNIISDGTRFSTQSWGIACPRVSIHDFVWLVKCDPPLNLRHRVSYKIV